MTWDPALHRHREEEAVAFIHSREPVTAPTNATAVPIYNESVFVHLCCGDIETISPATSVTVDPDFVIVYNGDETVARYARRDVYLCSKTQTSPILS